MPKNVDERACLAIITRVRIQPLPFLGETVENSDEKDARTAGWIEKPLVE